MATVKAVVLKHQKKEDGTYNVKFRITHNRASAYFASPYYVTDKQLDKNFEIKTRNNIVYDEVLKDIVKIRDILSRFSYGIEDFPVKEVAMLIEKKMKGVSSGIKIQDFAKEMEGEIKTNGTLKVHRSMMSKVCRYFGEDVRFKDVTYLKLLAFEKHQRNERGNNDTTINSTMGRLSYIFKMARRKYNNEDVGDIVINNPFQKYNNPKPSTPVKRAWSKTDFKNLLDTDCSRLSDKRMIAFDILVISFLLCGVNCADLYEMTLPQDGYLHYYRKKTRTRRSDMSEMIIKVQPELLPYLEKYKDPKNKRAFNFYLLYTNSDRFSSWIAGMIKHIRRILSIENLTIYVSRHTWATIAYNDLRISKDDIALSLIHSSTTKITDFYIKNDFDRVDDANRKVIDWVFYNKKE